MNEIRTGDCLQIMKLLILGGARIQTCITSPPYWGLRDYGVDTQIGMEATPSEYVARLLQVFRLVRDLLADDGTLWLNLGDTFSSRGGAGGTMSASGLVGGEKRQEPRPEARDPEKFGRWNRDWQGLKPKDLVGIPWRVAFALQEDGWFLRSDIIWAKPNPMPESVTDRPTKSHEYIFLLSKSADYFYDAEAIKERAAEPERQREDRVGGANGHSVRHSPCGMMGQSETRNKRSVWTVSTQPYAGAHFATFPPDLILPCVLAGSRPGDVVFDPFMGSGTTALVAKQNGRRYLGCELNPEYRALQDERLAQEVLFGPEVPA